MIKNRKLGHIGMATRDIDATVAWYEAVLGFEKIGDFQAPDGNRITFIRNGEGCVYELFPAQEDEEAGAYGKIDHYCFASGDVEKDYAYCIARGYPVTTGGIEALPGLWERGARYFKIGAPTGQQIEFCQIL